MGPARNDRGRLLEGLPGIDDVVWAMLARLDGTRQRQRIVFLSPEPRAGTTVMAAASAIGLLQHRRARVCLVETNVRSPAVAGYLGLNPNGLTDMLAGRARLDDCLQQPRGCNGLHVLPAGAAREPIPGEFTTEAFRAIIDGLAGLADYLVVDAPPVLDNVGSRLLLREADGAVLVLRTGKTRTTAVEHACTILAEAGAPVLGAIFNAFKPAGLFDGMVFGITNRPATPVAVSANYAWIESRNPAQTDAAATPHLEPSARDRAGQLASPALPPGSVPQDFHQRQIELLERRIAKLTRYLAKAEENLERMAAQRFEDPGVASIYRTAQGMSPEERALAFKQKLMQRIFQANLELRQKLARQN
jgi:Mrp family chromosome partitioning ATPase